MTRKYVIVSYITKELYDEVITPSICYYETDNDGKKCLFDNLSDAKRFLQKQIDRLESKLHSAKNFYKADIGFIILDTERNYYHVFDILEINFESSFCEKTHILIKATAYHNDNVKIGVSYELSPIVVYMDAVSKLHDEVKKFILDEISNGYDVKYIKADVSVCELISLSGNHVLFDIIDL